MAGRKLWSAEELERLSPEERNSIVEAGFVDDPSEVPDELLERARAFVRDHISANEAATSEP